ncbi:MAG: hypothetical protein ACYSU5_13595 [Planctomycetota bacterium]
MYAVDVVRERRIYWSALSPEPRSGRPQITPFENPAGQITFAGVYNSTISDRSRRNNTIPSIC